VAWIGHNESSWPVIGLALVSIAIGGRDTLRKGLVALRTLTLNINFLMALAVAGAVAIGQWPEAAMVTFLFGVAEMVEAASMDRARNAIRGLLEMAPDMAMMQDQAEQWHEVRTEEVGVGARVRVRPGERIPLDGTVKEGHSTVNQAPITGESLPVEKAVGDAVFAGSVNERGAFEFEVTARASDSTLARIARAVQQAQAQQAPTQRFIDRFARFYTPAVVLLALGVAVVPPLLLGATFAPWLYKALVLLVIACPCALVISTPVTVVSGLAAAARRGILVKGGVHLEAGRKLRVIALDKTGTLTHGKPQVTDVLPFGNRSENQVLQLAASLEAHSEHPVASAIVARWMGAPAQAPAQPTASSSLIQLGVVGSARAGAMLFVSHFESLTGRGVSGIIGGRKYLLGSGRMARENSVLEPHAQTILDRLEAEGKTAVVLGTEREALGILAVADTLRETSAQAVHELHSLGVRTVMLSGDNTATARAIAAQVGIEDARGDLLPEDKMAALQVLVAEHGGVGMVGDGINDAPALALATVGFAMGAAGSDTAIETADVALMEDDLRKLPLFISLSRATSNVLAQNIALAIGIKIVFFALALSGHATLWMAVFADMGGSLLVVFNGLRLLRFGFDPRRSKVASCNARSGTAGTDVPCCRVESH
jgi:Cd2+/Zn2+-exporting ATPase